VIFTTLIWGVVNGAKIALVISLWFAGLAQWWLARELKLGLLPRLWSAGMAVVGGHLAGRMELGAFGVVLSTAMSSLVFAGILYVARGGGRRAAVLLGVVTASALLSGQGYIQIGLIGTLPAFAFLLLDKKFNFRTVWKDFALAAVLTLLLAAPFILPFTHFSPNFFKEADPEFKVAQPLAYLPLNLVIDDWGYYNSEILGKFPYPHLYTLFIGWVPVIFAVIGLSMSKRADRPRLFSLGGGVVLAFMIGSAVILKWIVKVIPAVAGVRHPPQIAGLAVPLILGLSAYGLERVFNLGWPDMWFGFSQPSERLGRTISMKWFLLVPLVLSLRSGYEFTTAWIYTDRQTPELQLLLDSLKTETLQWVNPPFGEHFYIEPAVAMDLKLSPGIMTWRWKDRELPLPVLEANRAGRPSGPVAQIDSVDGVPIYIRYDQPYAAVLIGEQQVPCLAAGSGGWLEVKCSTQSAGRLIVKENMWSGWKAWRDRESVSLLGGTWLAVDAPAGKHTYTFRYFPWDVPLGIALSLIGVLSGLWLWFNPVSLDEEPGEEDSPHLVVPQPEESNIIEDNGDENS
jgi:hypothetical protein